MSRGFTKGVSVDVLYFLEFNPSYVQSNFLCNQGLTKQNIEKFYNIVL